MMNRTNTCWAVVCLLGAGLIGSACGSPAANGFDLADGGDEGSGSLGDGDLNLSPDTPRGEGDAAASRPTTCDVSCTEAGGTCKKAFCTLRENPGDVSGPVQGQLKAGGASDPSFQWLYPYDRTVFPRGLLSPTLQVGQTSADAVWVHISLPTMSYDGFFGASTPLQVQLPAASWKAINYAAGPTDSVAVSITKVSGGLVTGPVKESWTIASGSIRGAIYYETYGSAILGGVDSVGIMQIQPGATTPIPIRSGCGNVCHTASADGSTLVADVSLESASESINLKLPTAPPIYMAEGEQFTYGGIYPDGSFVISATGYRTWNDTPSLLYSTSTGEQIASPTWTVPNAGTIAFSPDGKRVAFNKGGSTISIASFSLSGYTFSGVTDLVTGPAAPDLGTLAWPAFTPDDKTIAYHAGSNAEYETDEGATGDIYLVDVASHTSVRADALDGYTPAGTTYLPANDPTLSFAPTILPEAVGGYFWVVFTSHRSYGNTLASMANGDESGKLWVAALDIDGTPGVDSTHPAFYLDGQESVADNLRGYWVLSPCKSDGVSCLSGDQCCEGFCRVGSSGGDECVSPPSGCSNEYEKCASSADCCDKSESCIGGFCAQAAPQ